MPATVLRVPRRLPALVVLLATLVAGLALALVPSTGARAETLTTGLTTRTGFAPGGGLPWESDQQLGQDLDLMVSSGATWVRLDFDWSSVEDVRGTYDWSNLDRVVGAARRRGLSVLALPAYTPAWARPAGTTTHRPPTDPSGYAAFVAAAAQRYVPQGVTAYEVWNEPNTAAFWQPAPDVAAYARLLQATAAAVRAVTPTATLLSAGLAPASDAADGSEVDPRTFLTRLYALGAGSAFDAVAVHPYSYPAMPSDAATASWNTFQKMTAMRATMVSHGDAAKKVWLTEAGAPTGTSSDAVSDATQAAIVRDTVVSAAALPWTGPVFLYAARDAGPDLTDREQNFGLVHHDGSPKPAWSTLLTLLGATTTVPAGPGLTTLAPANPAPTAAAPTAAAPTAAAPTAAAPTAAAPTAPAPGAAAPTAATDSGLTVLTPATAAATSALTSAPTAAPAAAPAAPAPAADAATRTATTAPTAAVPAAPAKPAAPATTAPASVTRPTAPAAPAAARTVRVRTVVLRGRVTVAWSLLAGVTSYRVERTTTSPRATHRTWVQRGTSRRSSLTDVAVRPGTTYYYRVVPVTARPLVVRTLEAPARLARA